MTRRATILGFAASVALHVLLVLADPRLPPPRVHSVHRLPLQYPAALVEFSESQQTPGVGAPEADVVSDRGLMDAVVDSSALPAGARTAGTAAGPVPAARGPVQAAVRDRLAYRASAAWRPREVELESYEACRERERAERLEREIADPRRGNVRLPTDPPPPARVEAGVRITVGPRRNPPPVGLPPPVLPDSMPTSRPYGEALYRYELTPVTARRLPGCADPAAWPR